MSKSFFAALIVATACCSDVWAQAATGAVAVSEPFNMTASMFRMVGGLLFCLGIFACGIHVYRRFAGQGSISGKRRLRIVERLQLSPKSSILLVSLDGKEVLISSGTDTVRVLSAEPARKFDNSLDEAYALGMEEPSCAA